MTFQELVNSKPIVLVDFYADWCGPCKMMIPILQEVKRKAGDDVRIVKIDVDKHQELSSSFGIQSIPTVFLYKNGELVWQKKGVARTNELLEVIQNN